MSKEGLKRGVVCAVVALAASLALWGRVAQTQGQGQGDKPVEQTRKNIQVLKGLPESQLFPEMNFISASLGVQCGFCHVSNGKDPKTGFTNWVWESDDKEEKKTARDMMRMVLAINGGNFGLSRGQVTCYTCHRGQNHPQNLPTLPLAVSGHEPAPTASPTPGAPGAPHDEHGGPGGAARPEQPTVQQVYDKYLAAVGGQAAAAKFQTQILKGTVAQSQDHNSTFEVTTKSPDKYLLVVKTPQGSMHRALNGATGWMEGPRGVRELGASEIADARRAADLLGVVTFKPAPSMRVIGRRKLNDRDMIIVVDRPSETVQRRYFFDAETGLLTRIMTLTDALLNNLPEQIDFEDYRDVDGAKLPFVVRVSSIDTFNSYTRTLTEVKHGVPVEDTLFNKPPMPAPAATPRP
jgi:photosynthetic reaction center cytochrome c subunit